MNDIEHIELFEATEAFGPFAQRKPLSETLRVAERKMRKRCRTVEACNEVISQINEEASAFNSHLKAMQNIAKQLEAGQIDKATAKKQVNPHYKALKKASDLVNYGQVIQNKIAVSEDDLKFTRDYIKGLMGIAQKLKAERKNGKVRESFIDGDFDPDFDSVDTSEIENDALEASSSSHSDLYNLVKAGTTLYGQYTDTKDLFSNDYETSPQTFFILREYIRNGKKQEALNMVDQLEAYLNNDKKKRRINAGVRTISRYM